MNVMMRAIPYIGKRRDDPILWSDLFIVTRERDVMCRKTLPCSGPQTTTLKNAFEPNRLCSRP